MRKLKILLPLLFLVLLFCEFAVAQNLQDSPILGYLYQCRLVKESG